MIKKTIYFFEEQLEDAELLLKELGLRDFSSLIRVALQEKLRKNGKIIEQARKEVQKRKV